MPIQKGHGVERQGLGAGRDVTVGGQMVEVVPVGLATQLAATGLFVKQDVLACPVDVARRGKWTEGTALIRKPYLLKQARMTGKGSIRLTS